MAKKTDINTLLSFFPEVHMPITFSEDLVTTFEKENQPLSQDVIQQYIYEWEGEVDEFTEFLPCLRLAETEHFHALVYWKGGLLKYEYVLVTLDKKGSLISRKPIASTIVEGELIKKSVAQIDEDFIIHIMAGENVGEEEYDAGRSQAFNMEILHTGDIIFSFGDEA